MQKQGVGEYFDESPNSLTVAQFAQVFPMFAVTEALDSAGCGTVRFRQASKERLVYYQMLLSLFRNYSLGAAYRVVEHALDLLENTTRQSATPTTAALIKGLDTIKPEVFQNLFQKFATPAGDLYHPGIGFRGKRKVSLDGYTLATEDTKNNRKFFGGPKNQHGETGLPQLRAVCLHETGSHLFFNAAVGPYKVGEVTLAKKLMPFVQSDWLMLMDRNFYSFDMFQELSIKGTAAIFRLQKGLKLNSEEQLADGSHIVTIYSSEDSKRSNGLKARLIQYKIVGAKKKTETIYLLTNILDPNNGTAEELAKVYAERWEHENALDELKTHLNDSSVTLRGKTPQRVLREFWGMLMSHYAVRLLMYKAAVTARIDSDRLSFTHAVEVVQEYIILDRNSVCNNCGHANRKNEKELMQDVLQKRLPERRARSSERSARRRSEKYSPIKGKKKTKKTNGRVKVSKGWKYPTPK
jgi:hypothetical protein